MIWRLRNSLWTFSCGIIEVLKKTYQILQVESVYWLSRANSHHELNVVDDDMSNVVNVDSVTHSIEDFVDLRIWN